MTTMNTSANITIFMQDVAEVENNLKGKTTLLVLKILVYGVTPSICLFGIIGNILSIVILRRHGLHKSSNILLVSLAFSDLCFLISFNNVPKALYDIDGDGHFLFSKGVSYFLYVIYHICTVFDYGMGFVALTIPAIITVERFIAVYFPLKLTTIVTPARTWAAVIFFAVYGMGVMVYSCFWSEFEYKFDPRYNRTVGFILRSDLFYRDWRFRSVVDQIHFGVKVQPLMTFAGCILIIIKVKMASIKRKKLSGSSQNSSVNKTTQTLMAVCIVYLLVCSFLILPALLPDSLLHFSLTSDESNYVALIMYQVMNLVLCFNSSWNFIIYIVFNKNFRDTYREIVGNHCFRPRQKISDKVSIR